MSSSTSSLKDANSSKTGFLEPLPPGKKMPENKRVLRKRVAVKKQLNREFEAPKKYRKPRNSDKSMLDSWKFGERKLLLEGLRSYGPEKTKLIANLIGTKSEAEIQEKIFRLRGDAACDIQITGGVNNEVRAPIEKWINSMNELICEDTDCSWEIVKTLGYIAKHETFADNQAPDLSWQNIYTYLGALAENRTVGLPTLSDIESTILLELMTDLGTTLNKLNTTPQRQILEHKVQLIHPGVKFTNKEQKALCASLLAHALGNDFTGIEHLLVDSTTRSSSSAQPSTSKTTEETIFEATRSLEGGVSVLPSNFTYSVSPSNLVPKNEVDLSEHVVLRHGEGLDKAFIKPKLFTFNPLCIPTKLLKFQPKS
ncbi:hypothetical protein ElyMa_005396700 [Elysia marginata]|uniref:Uncharacterized protein n=1 Tax=Elysia marginata TaxID=1093978 RepID=A0AAV4EFU1_9GAST|nr:hypothetical protein ElyMa_005396700 [Elysia marginata]